MQTRCLAEAMLATTSAGMLHSAESCATNVSSMVPKSLDCNVQACSIAMCFVASSCRVASRASGTGSKTCKWGGVQKNLSEDSALWTVVQQLWEWHREAIPHAEFMKCKVPLGRNQEPH